MNPKSFQHSITIRLKNKPLHVARRPVFSATDDLFSATGDVFEAFGRGAAQGTKKVSAPDAFGPPAAGLSVPKVRRSSPGSPKRIQKSGKRLSKKLCKK